MTTARSSAPRPPPGPPARRPWTRRWPNAALRFHARSRGRRAPLAARAHGVGRGWCSCAGDAAGRRRGARGRDDGRPRLLDRIDPCGTRARGRRPAGRLTSTAAPRARLRRVGRLAAAISLLFLSALRPNGPSAWVALPRSPPVARFDATELSEASRAALRTLRVPRAPRPRSAARVASLRAREGRLRVVGDVEACALVCEVDPVIARLPRAIRDRGDDGGDGDEREEARGGGGEPRARRRRAALRATSSPPILAWRSRAGRRAAAPRGLRGSNDGRAARGGAPATPRRGRPPRWAARSATCSARRRDRRASVDRSRPRVARDEPFEAPRESSCASNSCSSTAARLQPGDRN